MSVDDPSLDGPPDALRLLRSLSKDELVRIVLDDAKNGLAHDGLWFQAVEAADGMEAALPHLPAGPARTRPACAWEFTLGQAGDAEDTHPHRRYVLATT